MVHYLSDYVILFFAYATLGWCMETLYMGVRERRITNRGFLLGPCCPIYGAGMVGITLLFQDSHYSYWHVFFSIILLCSLLEYAVSALMERVFHTRWWDYHDMRFNIHGRICLETMLPFGLLGSSEQSVTHLSRAPSTLEAPDTTLLSITSGSVYERCTVSATARFCECSLQSARCSTARQTAARYTPRAAPMAEA